MCRHDRTRRRQQRFAPEQQRVLQGWLTIAHLYVAVFLLDAGEVFADVAAQVLMPAIGELGPRRTHYEAPVT
ncbi:MAG TPA: hypothetical protein VE800_10495 [Actinomycetota bacterium]|jgi:hypothetical protein|nr:hypothetical protein [Actinomycetota bacterium]